MKHIELFESYLSGSRAPLYHSSTMFMAPQILKDDELKDFGHGISFTRDKDFVYNECPVTFILDGDMLRDMKKPKQLDYYNKIDSRVKNKSVEFESEEIFAGNIKNLHKHLIAIRINDYIKFYRDSPENTREEYHEAYVDFMDALSDYKKKFGTVVKN
jgi:hypothetical protein